MKTNAVFFVVMMIFLAFPGGCTKNQTQVLFSFESTEEYKDSLNRIGFGRTVVAHENNFSRVFWRELTLYQWIQIYKASPNQSDLKARAFEEILSMSSKVTEYGSLYYLAPSGSESENRLEKMMLEKASTLADWLFIYTITRGRDSNCEQTAVRRLSEDCLTFKDWLFVYKNTPKNCELERLSVAKMASLASTQREWFLVYVAAPAGEEIEEKALSELKISGENLERIEKEKERIRRGEIIFDF